MANMFAFWGSLTTYASTAYATGDSTMPEGTGRQKLTLLSLRWGGYLMVNLHIGHIMLQDFARAFSMSPITFITELDSDDTVFLMSRYHFPPDRGEIVSFTVTRPGRDDKGYRRALQVQTQGTRIVGHNLNATDEARHTANWEVIYNKIVLTFWYEHIGGGGWKWVARLSLTGIRSLTPA